jgi:spore coat protein CotH
MKKIVVISIMILTSISSFFQNPGDILFNSSHIHQINITFTQPNWWDSLMYYKQHADSFNLSTQTMMGNFIIDGTPIDSVGVQLKGNSSFVYPGRKKPIKITFSEYVSGKKLEGLTVLNLNNNMLDPTMMREKLLLDFMNKKGLAPNGASLNSKRRGLVLLLLLFSLPNVGDRKDQTHLLQTAV